MNSHKNARLTLEGRKLLIECIAIMGLSTAAQAAGISTRTARKWFLRFEQLGVLGLSDRSSRPLRTRSSIGAELVRRIEHTFTQPCRPQTNGEAERFIQTCLRSSSFCVAFMLLVDMLCITHKISDRFLRFFCLTGRMLCSTLIWSACLVSR